ncbi:MAG: Eco57I restriction-modification methylase domain-containing protein, partial [Janthinobacterium lividum]
SELLHLIGLYEYKEGSKKLISRKKEGERNAGSLLENAIVNLDSHDKISRLDKPMQYGETYSERLYNVALELVITWINRILFLKLLEAQLLNYHKGDKTYTFLNKDKIRDFDDLDKLFFRVLAKKTDERSTDIVKLFGKVPYLNSSLFEPTELEHQTLFINGLEYAETLPFMGTTVLKDRNDKARKGSLNTLDYIFDFLNAYDFSSEGAEEIQEDNKTLINASVLGLIFEKINGYKDGSFFTPGFITMYMCRETIRRAVVQKFNETKNWELKDYSELYDQIKDKKEANNIINSLKICDPAVGSGHFLVSALNEIIAIKSDLKVLMSSDGRTLRDHHIEVVNDELIVTDDNNDLFKYNYLNPNSQTVQRTLFYEKQTIIENCLFGVDINPNSVKICRLRLWIELLKNAYYKTATNGQLELETLPNIDINIKTGNSLISRFALDVDLKQALKKNNIKIETYRNAVDTYRNARDKAQKREMENIINAIKNSFRTEISRNGKEYSDLSKLRGQLQVLISTNQDLFGVKRSRKDLELEQRRLELSIEKQEQIIEEIKNNKIYENAFEWRFEFPEVLNNEGDFVGFDVVIGNPPYGVNLNKTNTITFQSQYQTFTGRGESYALFIERASNILTVNGNLSFIIPDTILNLGFTELIRAFLLKNTDLQELCLLPSNVFADATVDTILLFFNKRKLNLEIDQKNVNIKKYNKKLQIDTLEFPDNNFNVPISTWNSKSGFNLESKGSDYLIIGNVEKEFPTLKEFTEIFSGVKVYEVGKGIPAQTEDVRRQKPYTSDKRIDNTWLPFFDGKNISKYNLTWNNNNWLHYGKWLAAPRNPMQFEGEKILIRKIIGKTLIAHYIPYTSYCNTLLFVLKLQPSSGKITYKALLSVINSKFIGWYFRKRFQISDDDIFPQIMIRDILNFAVPNKNNTITKELEKLVDQILEQKQLGTDTISLEKQIDQLVYQLYNLTEEEIKIVEGAS